MSVPRKILGSELARREDESVKTGPTYQDIIRGDVIPPPADVFEHHLPELSTTPIARDRYTSIEFHNREMSAMWTRVWQLAGREEQIPEPGDVIVYEIADSSVLVVRASDGRRIRAFRNTCLHRGTKLCAVDTHVNELRCPFHGFTWSLEGKLIDIPSRWDFPHIEDKNFRLHEVRCETWGGFVFINFDRDAAPLLDYLEVLPQHFTGFSDFNKKYIAASYRKKLDCNWKAAIEAFIENYHSLETHPQTVRTNADDNTQYDIFPGNRHVSRFMIGMGVQSPHLARPLTEEEIFSTLYGFLAPNTTPPAIPAGMTARNYLADLSRKMGGAASGNDYSGCSDAEALDPIQYLVFPNMVLFRGFGFPVVYRFRPDGNNPSASIFDMFVMRDVPAAGRPEPAEVREFGDRSFMEAAQELPTWSREIYDQDTRNLALQQEGLKAGGPDVIWLSREHEVRIRHLHETLDEYLAKGPLERKSGPRAVR